MNAAVDDSTGADAGAGLYALVEELYPICRSITGNGVRETLRILAEHIPLEQREVPSGTAALDWVVPSEWNITDAYVKDASGARVVDFRKSNLHVVSYSVPVKGRMTLAELRPHLHSLPEHPAWIPYRTSYYREDWGFCLADRDLRGLADGVYDVCIDSTLTDGHLTYGEAVLPGESSDEILVSCHVCHPSLANDNLSGIAVATFLAKALASRRRAHTFRFVFVPGTIGAITWLAFNEAAVARVRHGLVLTCIGDPGPLTYKRSRRGTATVDRAASHVLRRSGEEFDLEDFVPWGYDERQYCSPGYDLAVGCLMRTPHGRFPEYHTSADDLALVRPAALADSLAKALAIFEIVDADRAFSRRDPRGEPQLSRHGLDLEIARHEDPNAFQLALLWTLNLSDGNHSLLDVAERADLPFALVLEAAGALEATALIEHAPAP